MSKLSLHISQWLNPDLTFAFIEKTQPAVVKVFGVGGLDDTKIREARRRSPGTLWIGRQYFNYQLLEDDSKFPGDAINHYDAIADAQNAFHEVQSLFDKFNGLIDVWEGYNEVPIDTDEPLTERNRQKARNFSAFTVALAKLMHNAGQKYAAYSFSTGNPVHVELWDLLVPGLRASDYLALHEYIAPDANFQNFNTSMCNRYREIYARVPHDAQRPILITECGVDYLGQQGYKGKLSLERYLSLMKAYDAELMKDPQVIGATIFCYGIDSPRWKTYDIGGDFSKVLAEYIAATPTPKVTTPAPKPKPPVTPAPQPPVTPTPPGELPFDKARWFTEQAVREIEGGRASEARTILLGTVIPWFYATVSQYADNLTAAQAHTAARFFTEEAVRKIEANDPSSAHTLLLNNVLAWFYSNAPQVAGTLSAEPSGVEIPSKPSPEPPPRPRRPASKGSHTTYRKRGSKRARGSKKS